MWFLIKCLMVFALFYAIFAVEQRAESAHAKSPPAEAKVPAAAAARRAPAPRPEEVFAHLRRTAADRLLAAAREKCLENASDCAAALKAAGPGLAAAATRR